MESNKNSKDNWFIKNLEKLEKEIEKLQKNYSNLPRGKKIVFTGATITGVGVVAYIAWPVIGPTIPVIVSFFKGQVDDGEGPGASDGEGSGGSDGGNLSGTDSADVSNASNVDHSAETNSNLEFGTVPVDNEKSKTETPEIIYRLDTPSLTLDEVDQKIKQNDEENNKKQ